MASQSRESHQRGKNAAFFSSGRSKVWGKEQTQGWNFNLYAAVVHPTQNVSSSSTQKNGSKRDCFNDPEDALGAYDNIPVEVKGFNVPKAVESFKSLCLHPAVHDNIQRCNFRTPTPVQKHAIPVCLAARDLIACAQTGSGKTAAFCLPILDGILRSGVSGRYCGGLSVPLALILAPTRELAQQIANEATRLSHQTEVRVAVVYGGTPLQNGCADILVATPGRLNDLVDRGMVELSMVRYLVLDEADRMLDMGFEPQIRRIVQESTMPATGVRQTLMFSATFPPELKRLASEFLREYIFLAAGRVGSITDLIEQKVVFVREHEKRNFLAELIDRQSTGLDRNVPKILVYVQTKRGADDLESWLCSRGYFALSIHGDKSQREREHALRSFRMGCTPILVATAVASRGLDILDVAHVINFDMPTEIEDYVHRIGRTGRAGKKGLATAFFCEQDTPLAKELINVLQRCDQQVPEWLMRTASTASETRWYSRGSRFGGNQHYQDPSSRNRSYASFSG